MPLIMLGLLLAAGAESHASIIGVGLQGLAGVGLMAAGVYRLNRKPT
jgi:hypothetical protein